MIIETINKTHHNLPQQYFGDWVEVVVGDLKKKEIAQDQLKNTDQLEIAIVFMGKEEARQLNLQYRKKDYATDVLSFESFDRSSLGELVLCYDVVERQAKEHNLSFREEAAYLILHGILHLLGFEHENGGAEEEEMMNLQDDIFERRDQLLAGYRQEVSS
ncbi:MAG: rRNA maturation RNase YbeY [Bdellovibrionales bacterium]|nr:rRNA maturation RNase YbeY [Bdellovibrionales bacterium]